MDWQQGPTGHMDVSAETFSDALRPLLRTEVLRGEGSASQIAGLCLMHRRTLSRRLRAEGTRFRRVADEMRFEIACLLFSVPHLSFAEIGTMLGFSEGSAFTRAFRRWSGQTPTAWRASHPRQRQVRASQ